MNGPGFGDQVVQPLVMRFNGHGIDHLQIKGNTDAQGMGGFIGQKPVIVASTIAQAPATRIKNAARNDDHVYPRRIDSGQTSGRLRDIAVARHQIEAGIAEGIGLEPMIRHNGQRDADFFAPIQTLPDQGQGFHLASEIDIKKNACCPGKIRQAPKSVGYGAAFLRSCLGEKPIPRGQDFFAQGCPLICIHIFLHTHLFFPCKAPLVSS